MPIITQMLCGSCGTVQEANQWFVVSIDEYGLMIRPLDAMLLERRTSGTGTEEYYCGQKCALKSIAQWMDGSPPTGAALLKGTLAL
jgi:hypothetical protein